MIFFSYIFISSKVLLAEEIPTNALKVFYVKSDYKKFYHYNNSFYLGLGLSTSALLAHSSADTNFHRWYQKFAVNKKEFVEVAKVAKVFGERPWVLAYVGLSLFDSSSCSSQICNGVLGWADQSRRMVVVGLPLVWGLQYTLGARRPYQGGSKWTYFDDSHAVSGHAFIGAIPFFGLASQVSNPYLKTALIGLSTLPAISRIHDEQHYLSQSLMGWVIAWRAYEALQPNEANYTFSPFANGTHIGLSYQTNF